MPGFFPGGPIRPLGDFADGTDPGDRDDAPADGTGSVDRNDGLADGTDLSPHRVRTACADVLGIVGGGCVAVASRAFSQADQSLRVSRRELRRVAPPGYRISSVDSFGECRVFMPGFFPGGPIRLLGDFADGTDLGDRDDALADGTDLGDGTDDGGDGTSLSPPPGAHRVR